MPSMPAILLATRASLPPSTRTAYQRARGAQDEPGAGRIYGEIAVKEREIITVAVGCLACKALICNVLALMYQQQFHLRRAPVRGLVGEIRPVLVNQLLP